MEVTKVDDGKFRILSLDGDLDAASSIELDTALEEAVENQMKCILINCENLDYISSPGIGVLTSRLEECEIKGISIVLFAMNEKILKVFKILGLDQLMPIRSTVDEAKMSADGVQH